MNGQRRRFKGLILRNEANKSFVMNNNFRTLFSQHPPEAYAKAGATTGAAMLATAMLPQTWHRRSHAFQPGKTLSLERSKALRRFAGGGSRLLEVKRNPQAAKERFRAGRMRFRMPTAGSGVTLSLRVLGPRKRKGEEWPLATLN
jgi:hypothetical protein